MNRPERHPAGSDGTDPDHPAEQAAAVRVVALWRGGAGALRGFANPGMEVYHSGWPAGVGDGPTPTANVRLRRDV